GVEFDTPYVRQGGRAVEAPVPVAPAVDGDDELDPLADGLVEQVAGGAELVVAVGAEEADPGAGVLEGAVGVVGVGPGVDGVDGGEVPAGGVERGVGRGVVATSGGGEAEGGLARHGAGLVVVEGQDAVLSPRAPVGGVHLGELGGR